MRRGVERLLEWRLRGLTLIIISMLALLAYPPILPAATLEQKQAEARRVQQQIDELKAQGQRVAEEYNAALTELESIRILVNENKEKLNKAQGDFQRAKTILQNRLRAIYMLGDVSSTEVLLESASIDDLLNRYDYLRYISGKDLDIFNRVRELKEEITRRQLELEEQEARQRQALAMVQQKQMEVQASIAAQQKLLSSLNAEILQLLEEMANTRGGGGSVNITSFIFPVKGPHSYSNDWHAPRKGHLHQGCDIFAALETPCVACVSGTVYQGEGKNAGLYVRLVGDDGNVYYYMHLNRFGQSGRVSAGTVIGYVGDTGNAKGTPPHLHFEIHPGGGEAINPYPILVAHDR
jgi:murein DD-endopeptidase MepM/ murein hydrolase activator NlpD